MTEKCHMGERFIYAPRHNKNDFLISEQGEKWQSPGSIENI